MKIELNDKEVEMARELGKILDSDPKLNEWDGFNEKSRQLAIRIISKVTAEDIFNSAKESANG